MDKSLFAKFSRGKSFRIFHQRCNAIEVEV